MAINTTQEWRALVDHYEGIERTHLRQLFAAEPDRGKTMQLAAGSIYLDYSKNRLTKETLSLLAQLARAADSRTFCTAGTRSAIRIAMMAMTTSNSIRVNP